MMWAGQIFLGILGMSAGVVVAGGLFSFIVELGVISDFADRTHTANRILLYEDAVSAGAILGTQNPLFGSTYPDLSDWNSRTVRAVGIFRTICRDFCRLLVDGTCRDPECISNLYETCQDRPVCSSLYSDAGTGKRNRCRTLFLERLVIRKLNNDTFSFPEAGKSQLRSA